ncbi:hypothetical protein BLNAU_6792 [Blattamonas nauphoetae]|uniref:Uncharacterized protein n=1 Tax=Blattamonas nauphoetae TaxID=2049346 RepID=A0ABQ9Y3I7_9EUKA|nr:hypothetical protein BLNAU_6792 [Blattamonas nauphoetae]
MMTIVQQPQEPTQECQHFQELLTAFKVSLNACHLTFPTAEQKQSCLSTFTPLACAVPAIFLQYLNTRSHSDKNCALFIGDLLKQLRFCLKFKFVDPKLVIDCLTTSLPSILAFGFDKTDQQARATVLTLTQLLLTKDVSLADTIIKSDYPYHLSCSMQDLTTNCEKGLTQVHTIMQQIITEKNDWKLAHSLSVRMREFGVEDLAECNCTVTSHWWVSKGFLGFSGVNSSQPGYYFKFRTKS